MRLPAALALACAALLVAAARPAAAQTRVWSTDLKLPSEPAPAPEKAAPDAKRWSGSTQVPSPPEGSGPTPEPVRRYAPGDAVEVHGGGGSQLWYPGVVDRAGGGRYFIKYRGTIAPADGWAEPTRMRPLGGAPASALQGASWKAGDVVEVSWKGTWYLATILEAGRGRFKVHYARFDSSWDEWVEPARIRPAPAGARTSRPTPTGRFVCQAFVAGQLQNQGELVLHADGTYLDAASGKRGTWTHDAATHAVRFSGVLANGARATYVPTHRHGMLRFDWGKDVRRECYR